MMVKKLVSKILHHYIQSSEVTQILRNNSVLIKNLINENLEMRGGNQISQELSTSIKNGDEKEIWRCILLCIYQIRNNFFHSGITVDYFKSINKLLKNCINLAILEII